MTSSDLPLPATVATRFPRRLRRRFLRRERRGLLALRALLLIDVVTSFVWLKFFADADHRTVVAPALAATAIALTVITVLYGREGQFPLFDLGTIFAATTLLYAVVPIINFVASGLQWSWTADNRLRQYPVDVGQVAAISWHYVVYMGVFSSVYLLVRGRTAPVAADTASVVPPRRAVTVAIVVLLVISTFGFFVLLFGSSSMPYVGVQFLHIFQSVRFTLKQCLLVLLMFGWRSLGWRTVFLVWLAVEVAITVNILGSRSETALLVLTAGLVYHRVVKPLAMSAALLSGAALVAGFLTFGVVRDVHGWHGNDSVALTSSNEFQVLFANAYDLQMRKSVGELQVPWQIYVSELYMVVPSQLLPFRKIDPSDWYVEMLGVRDQGLMFGVIAQSIIGRDYLELVVRGAVLAILFALAHRWYARHSRRFWPTMFYLFLCTFTYYTFRSTTLFIIYMIVYYFIPVVLAASLVADLLSRGKSVTRRALARLT